MAQTMKPKTSPGTLHVPEVRLAYQVACLIEDSKARRRLLYSSRAEKKKNHRCFATPQLCYLRLPLPFPKQLHRVRMETTNIRDVLTSFSPSLDFLAISSGDGRIKIWDTIKGHVQTDFANIVSTDETDFFAKPEGGHLSVDYTCMKWLSLEKKKKRKLRNSLLILGTGGGDVLGLDVSAGQLKWRVSDCHPGGVTAVSFPTNGSCVYTAGVDGMICELDSITGNLLAKFKASTKAISSMSVSPDGKVLATAAAQLKIFSCSDRKKMQKFSGHPGAVRCMTFSDEGKYVISSASGERYIAIWEVDGSKKKSSCCVLAMDHPAIFIDTKSIGVEGLSVLSISEMGVCYLWNGINMEELRNSIPTKVSMEDNLSFKGSVPAIFSAKLQSFSKPATGNLFLAHGLIIKPSFEKITLQCGSDVMLKSSLDGILIPLTQSQKSKKGVENKNQITALDRANTEHALLPVLNISNADDGDSRDMTSSKDNMEMDQVKLCLEDRLRTEGILSSDNDFTSNKLQLSKPLKGVNLEDNMPQKQMIAAVSSMTPDDAYTLLKVLLAMWQSSDYIKSQEPTSQLLDSLYKLTKSKGEVIQSLLQLSGRLQLFTAQINKAADKSQILKQEEESEDEAEEEEEELLYDEEDESSSDGDNNN
ncbi:unnamed protein product [Lactuca saligna]|uniref:Small-subunit processome Utp12 domain-containing protein n=1 Tax=Lactuca saligna TaxID=75948 RepID=A0AA36ECX8_LACSI|nr:unnamed protein product [Lactuca saligna]